VKFDLVSKLPIAVESQFGTVRHPRISIPAVRVCRTWYERCSANPKTAIILRILLSFMASIRPARTLPLDSVKQTLVRRAVGRRLRVERRRWAAAGEFHRLNGEVRPTPAVHIDGGAPIEATLSGHSICSARWPDLPRTGRSGMNW